MVMNDWHSLDLGDGVQAFEPTQAIMNAYGQAYLNAGSPEDMAVFSRYDLKTNIVTVYFSPAATQLAESFGAKRVDKPIQDEHLSLLVGNAKSFDIHFPSAGV